MINGPVAEIRTPITYMASTNNSPYMTTGLIKLLKLAREHGFEPQFLVPETNVLPLDDSRTYIMAEAAWIRTCEGVTPTSFQD